MEQPCYKCGQPVEEGVPFCSHCAAPQIRVVLAEPPPSLATPGAELSPSAPASETVPVIAVPVHWSQTIRPCALAAAIATLLVALRLYPIVAMFSAGFLSAVFYRQRWRQAPMRAGIGARLGSLSGLLWFAMLSIIEAVLVLGMHQGDEIRKQTIAAIDQAASQISDPHVLELFNRLKTPEGLEAVMIAGIITSFVAAIVLGAIGGAVAGALLRRQDKS
jgi:hypothetical protein